MKTNSKRSFFLIAAVPTPNGPLHLGHIAGPFLKLDIIKRFNQQINNTVFYYCGTDCYDSYVLSKAHVTQQSPFDIANQYHTLIKNDLDRMLISLEDFINPLSIDTRRPFEIITKNLCCHLTNNDKTFLAREQYPYLDNYLPASFLTGKCPSCREMMHGFICEQCGVNYQPEMILEKQCKYSTKILTSRTVESLFLRINEEYTYQHLHASHLADSYIEVANQYLKNVRAIRLTVPGSWGIKANATSVYYNYSTFLSYCFFFGSLCQERFSLPTHPLDKNSTFEIVGSFGIDNAFAFLVDAVNFSLTQSTYKTFSHYLPNHFMTLNGKKFSTSRGHAIWVSELPEDLSIDLLRLYLIKMNADKGANDFNEIDFNNYYNTLAHSINKKFNLYQENKTSENDVCNHLLANDFLGIMQAKLENGMPENYCAKAIVEDIEKWISLTVSQTNYLQWLKGFAIIAYSVMPSLAQSIWEALGERDIPVPEKFFNNDGLTHLNRQLKNIKLISNNKTGAIG